MKEFWNNRTTFARILMIAGLITGLYFGITALKNSGLIPNKEDNSLSENKVSDLKANGAKELDVCVVTWPGYGAGPLFNEGYKASEKSRYLTEYNLIVNFHVVDDFDASRKGFISGDYDLIWQTAGALTTEMEGMQSNGIEPVVVFQSDWSRGGDAIVARKGISNMSQLTSKSSFGGKNKVAVAPMTPSHTFLLKALEAEGKTLNDIDVIEVASAIDAADLFKAGEVDASVVWSPDDITCVESQNGASIIISTKTATNIIADVFYAKRDWLDNNEDIVTKFMEGWFIGASEINGDINGAKDKTAHILAEGLNIPLSDAKSSMENVRFCTYGDNLNFFGLNDSYKGVTGEELYSSMAKAYNKIGYAPTSIPKWRDITNISLLENIKLSGSNHLAEGGVTFTEATHEDEVAEAVTTKPVSISFGSGSSTLDNNAKYIIDKEFVDIAKSFASARIRVEGNTDNTGNYNSNKTLSEKRAQSVVNYLIEEYGFDSNRFVVVGNGPDNAVNDGVKGSNVEYRSTDFQLLKN